MSRYKKKPKQFRRSGPHLGGTHEPRHAIAPMVLEKNVFFIGFMGAGKSSVARKVARITKVPSLDMDKYIARSQGKAIPAIFDEGGEELFRRIETETLRQIAGMEDAMLVSCGGGIVQMPENIEILRSAGVVVHLLVDADEAASRISDLSSRPLFNDIESARALCDSRLSLYDEAADITISTKGKSIGRTANEVMRALRSRGILRAPDSAPKPPEGLGDSSEHHDEAHGPHIDAGGA